MGSLKFCRILPISISESSSSESLSSLGISFLIFGTTSSGLDTVFALLDAYKTRAFKTYPNSIVIRLNFAAVRILLARSFIIVLRLTTIKLLLENICWFDLDKR